MNPELRAHLAQIGIGPERIYIEGKRVSVLCRNIAEVELLSANQPWELFSTTFSRFSRPVDSSLPRPLSSEDWRYVVHIDFADERNTLPFEPPESPTNCILWNARLYKRDYITPEDVGEALRFHPVERVRLDLLKAIAKQEEDNGIEDVGLCAFIAWRGEKP